MTVAFCQYISFIDPANAAVAFGKYQNFYINQSNDGHTYLPFLVGAGVGESGGDRPSTNFTCPRNDISIGIVTEAVDKFWSLKVDTVMINAKTLARIGLFISETWLCSSYAQDDNEGRILTMNLSSPFDAVDSQIPPILLTEALCGALPPPGGIQIG